MLLCVCLVSASSIGTCSEPEYGGSPRIRPMPFEWELPLLSDTLVHDLMARFGESPTSLPGHLIFNLALQYSQDGENPALLLQLMCAASY